ncbi:MAG: DNA polymerase-3 subunit gamma/tau [Candidatus Saccharimonadales bacterium]|jgi:DNA polymerase-3 subunit gamma/tau
MGQALYRKYRPRSLDQVVGQPHITDTLRNALRNDSVRHAYLFTGLRGSGKTSVARILAHEVNKLDYNEDANHLDIIEIDAASNRRIDEIRDLRDKVHIVPTSSEYKVYIIDEVHMLTREAFNALLKTLEEPPEHAIFILATTEIHKVPATIISRTQRFTFKPVSSEYVSDHLNTIAKAEKLSIDKEALDLLAHYGKGSFRDSISMLDQISGFDDKDITKETVLKLLGLPDDGVIDNIISAIGANDSNKLFSDLEQLRANGADPAISSRKVIDKLRESLMSGKGKLAPTAAVRLMKELLPLTGAEGTYEGLEIALLGAIKFNEDNYSAPATKAMAKVEKSEPEIVEKKGVVKKEPKVAAPDTVESTVKETPATPDVSSTEPVPTEQEVSTETEEPYEDVKPKEAEKAEAEPESLKPAKQLSVNEKASWNDILLQVKQKNNTLHGILRMAEVELTDDSLNLIFKFDFHKKQLMIQKNTQLLNSIVAEKLGKGYRVESVVKKQDKHDKKAIVKTAAKPSNDAVSSVSNIFGGAELLDS